MQPQPPRLAAVDHPVGRLLHRSAEGDTAPTWPAQHFKHDLGSEFTSNDFIEALQTAGITISMDGKGAWRDNIFVERLWRTIKYEEVYLRAYSSGSEAQTRSATTAPLRRKVCAFIAQTLD